MKGPVAVAALCVLAITVAACGGGEDATQQPMVATTQQTLVATTQIPDVTTSSPSATTVAPTPSQDLLLTFDGEDCTYEGPSEGVLSEPLNLKLINNSEVFVFGVVLWVPPDRFDEMLPKVGTDFPTTQEETETSELTFYSFKSNRPQFFVEVRSGSESSISAYVAAPGAYVLDCVQIEDAAMTHVWRPAAIEMAP